MQEPRATSDVELKTNAIDSIELATTRTILLEKTSSRLEHDLLGSASVPQSAYWGIHSFRAVENFPITGVSIGHFGDLVRALAMVKQAAARANRILGALPASKAEMIEQPVLQS